MVAEFEQCQLPVINTDINPFIPPNCTIITHALHDPLLWDVKHISALHLRSTSPLHPVTGKQFYDMLEGQKLLNACVTDHLYEHPTLFPYKWFGLTIGCWGSVFQDDHDRQFVMAVEFNLVAGLKRRYIYFDEIMVVEHCALALPH